MRDINSRPQTEDEWKIHSINIHGLFFERWCQSVVVASDIWRLEAANYPVAFPLRNVHFPTRESNLDLRVEFNSGTERRPTLLIECKKNNPEFVDWIFFPKDPAPSAPFLSINRIHTHEQGSKWGAERVLAGGSLRFPFASDARETRGTYLDYKGNEKQKTRTANDAITAASFQIALATQAITLEELTRSQDNADRSASKSFIHWDFFPIIVTTARLFTCEFDPAAVDPETGEISTNGPHLEPQTLLVYEYPLPSQFQWDYPVVTTRGQALYDEARLHILVVHSTFFPEWLENFYRQYYTSFV